ncbi:hypothetical protein EI94DRAFT_1735395 [Lactarius quietus]|nr:hypothetical protein EI94DRAFT_1735395 [Lactarius quietus]
MSSILGTHGEILKITGWLCACAHVLSTCTAFQLFRAETLSGCVTSRHLHTHAGTCLRQVTKILLARFRIFM